LTSAIWKGGYFSLLMSAGMAVFSLFEVSYLERLAFLFIDNSYLEGWLFSSLLSPPRNGRLFSY
jgi:hypothetical protein